MNWKQPAYLVGAICVGFVSGTGFYRSGDPPATHSVSPDSAPVVIAAPASVAEPDENSDQQLATLQKELEDQRRKSAMLAINIQPLLRMPQKRTTSERREKLQALHEASRASTEQRDNDKLLAAGFTMERIKWLRRRGEERYSMAMQADYERRHKGLATTPQANVFEEDVDLVKDIGEDEYDRYRQALGRPLSVSVSRVQPGSGADIAGIRPGDELIRYDGNRVYSLDQLKFFASGTTADGRVPIEVRRAGQIVRVSISGGSTGVEAQSASQIRFNAIESAMPESVRNAMRQGAPANVQGTSRQP